MNLSGWWKPIRSLIEHPPTIIGEKVEYRVTRGCMAEQVAEIRYGRIIAVAHSSVVPRLKHCRGMGWFVHWTRHQYFSNGFAPDKDTKLDVYDWEPAEAFYRHEDGVLRWDS